MPQEHLEKKIARLEKMEHFSAELLMRPKGHKILKHSCAELLKSCSYRTILRARHNVAVTRIVTLTPMQQINFFVFIHFCQYGSCDVDHKDVNLARQVTTP